MKQKIQNQKKLSLVALGVLLTALLVLVVFATTNIAKAEPANAVYENNISIELSKDPAIGDTINDINITSSLPENVENNCKRFYDEDDNPVNTFDKSGTYIMQLVYSFNDYSDANTFKYEEDVEQGLSIYRYTGDVAIKSKGTSEYKLLISPNCGHWDAEMSVFWFHEYPTYSINIVAYFTVSEPVEKTYTLNVNDYDTETAIPGAKVKYYAQNNQYDFTETEPGVYSVTVENEEDFVGYAVIYHDDYEFGLVPVDMNEKLDKSWSIEKADMSLCGNEQAHKGFVLEAQFEGLGTVSFYLPQIHFCWETIEEAVETFGGFKIGENGVLSISYEGQTFYKVMPICEDGYKFDHYNLNGNKVEGDTLQFQGEGDNAEIFYASVETPGDDPVVDPSSSAQTGDMNFAIVAGLCIIAIAAGTTLVVRKRKLK